MIWSKNGRYSSGTASISEKTCCRYRDMAFGMRGLPCSRHEHSLQQRRLERLAPGVCLGIIGAEAGAEFPVRPAEAPLLRLPRNEPRPAHARFEVGRLVRA